MSREETELREDEADLAYRKKEELATHAGTFFSLFSKRRRSVSTSLSKRRMTEKAKLDVEESVEAIAEFKAELDEMAEDMKRDLADVEQKWADIAAETGEFNVAPYKKDIVVTLFGIAWQPYYLADVDGEIVELAGYKPESA